MGNASCAGQLSRLRRHPVTHHHLAGRGPVLPQSGSRKPSASWLPRRPTHVLKVNWPPADAQRAALCPHALAGCPACLLSSHCVQFQTFPSIVNTDSIKTQPVRRSVPCRAWDAAPSYPTHMDEQVHHSGTSPSACTSTHNPLTPFQKVLPCI